MAAACDDVCGEFQVVRRKRGKRTQRKDSGFSEISSHITDDSYINVESIKNRIVKCRDELVSSEFYIGVLKSLERAIQSAAHSDASQVTLLPTASCTSHDSKNHLHIDTDIKPPSQERSQISDSFTQYEKSYSAIDNSIAENTECRRVYHSPANNRTTENTECGLVSEDRREGNAHSVDGAEACSEDQSVMPSIRQTGSEDGSKGTVRTLTVKNTQISQAEVGKKEGMQSDSETVLNKVAERLGTGEEDGQVGMENDIMSPFVKIERSQTEKSEKETVSDGVAVIIKDKERSENRAGRSLTGQELKARVKMLDEGECGVLHCGSAAGQGGGEVRYSPQGSLSILVYGLGNFASCPIARYQLALVLAFRQHWKVSAAQCEVYDPKFTETEKQLLVDLGCSVIQRNEEGKHRVAGLTLAVMPHCAKALFNNLLWANWSPQQLQQLVIMGNSFSNMLDSIPQRLWEGYINYVAMISAQTSEEPVVATPAYNTIFNDLSIHWFLPSSLLQLSPDTWLHETQPVYDPNDLEIILSSS